MIALNRPRWRYPARGGVVAVRRPVGTHREATVRHEARRLSHRFDLAAFVRRTPGLVRTASRSSSAGLRATIRAPARGQPGAQVARPASRSSMKSRSPFGGIEIHFPAKPHSYQAACMRRDHPARRGGGPLTGMTRCRILPHRRSTPMARHERGTRTAAFLRGACAPWGWRWHSTCSPSLRTPRRPASGASGGSSARALAAARRTATRGARSMARRGRSRRDMGSTRRSNDRCCDRRVPRGRVEYARWLGLDRAARRGPTVRRA